MIVSFGYKHGPVPGADLTFDVRHLANPHQDPVLRDLEGTDPRVIQWVLASPGAERLVRTIVAQVRRHAAVPILVAIGCTGGKHRSVVIAAAVGQLTGEVVEHRDVGKCGGHPGAPSATVVVTGSGGTPPRPCI